MQHHEHLLEHSQLLVGGKALAARMNGRFYTPEFLADQLAQMMLRNVRSFAEHKVAIIDPFCGDGRLIEAFLRLSASSPKFRGSHFSICLWDNDADAVELARKKISACGKKLKLRLNIESASGDSFIRQIEDRHDILLTNPPWESLKPDRREIAQLTEKTRSLYVRALQEYDRRLAKLLPHSQPEKKFSGWGTNLSRCGLEFSIKLLRQGGHCGIILPSSLFSDQVSAKFRQWVFDQSTLHQLISYPAEARLFEGVDQPCVAALLERKASAEFAPLVTRFDNKLSLLSESHVVLSEAELAKLGHAIPLDLDVPQIQLLLRLGVFPRLNDFCNDAPGALWLGREWDETGHKRFISSKGTIPFVKGRMVSRYATLDEFTDYVSDASRPIPSSASHARVAWRDISRRSQVRRMIATLIPAGCVTGNSLHVGYFKDADTHKLHALLGIMNSLSFEFQLRSKLGTGHVSLGSVRAIHVPALDDERLIRQLSELTQGALRQEPGAEAALEVAVAHAYGLKRADFVLLLGHFERLPETFRTEMLQLFGAMPNSSVPPPGQGSNAPSAEDTDPDMKVTIPNHYSAKLSKLDLEVAIAVPPGGNWKDIPHEVPSKRLEQIRISFAAGEGSRSTYYGRLHPDRPSYTINTYFNRPGNGCHLHYDYAGGQHRVLSEREAARLQSFPDDFVFQGGHGAIQKQIGNAVPPLLAFQIARALPVVGQYVDLFSGAGGLSLGFKWAGWTPIVANDIESSFLDTYESNIHPNVVRGDIREKKVFDAIVASIAGQRKKGTPLIVIGGPPCQGFSTAGNRRSLDDERNHLFGEFKALVEAIRPDGFVFENVTGLLSMNRGEVFKNIQRELQILDNPLSSWVLNAHLYGVPQRRKRLFLLSLPKKWKVTSPPAPPANTEIEGSVFEATAKPVSVSQALSDLPALHPGEDGSGKPYLTPPATSYQRLMRGIISPLEFLSSLGVPERSPQ